jgi:hypothetical protein
MTEHDRSDDIPSPAGPRSGAWRRRAFVGLVVACAAIAVASVAFAVLGEESGTAVQDAASALAPEEGRVLFQHVARDDGYARVGVAAVDAPGDSRSIRNLTCERVHYAGNRGLCLIPKRTLGALAFTAAVFGPDLRVRKRLTLPGINSRARVSPDGRYGATTGFVAGHSYAQGDFSTETTLIDLTTGKRIANVEDFRVERDGRAIRSVDFNFWGVTFADDGNRIYATLATRGTTYLVEGSITARRFRVLHENVECPSLSPDGTRVAYKKRVGDPGEWRLHVLDLRTLKETALAETRAIDDQAEWLDDGNVLYGLDSNVWVVPADGTGKPRVFLRDALSPAVVRS